MRPYRSGIRVPADLSVIGFDDIHLAQVMMPPLTTVHMSRFALAKAAVAALRTHVEQPEDSAATREFAISTDLVVRESTGPAPAKTKQAAAIPSSQ